MIQTVVIPVIVIVSLVVVNGVFVAAEFALVGARRSRLETMAAEGSRSARWLVEVFEKHAGKDGYIAVAQLGITLASIGLGMYGEPAVAEWLYGPFEAWGLSDTAAHTVGFVVALSGITFMHVVLGEMIPKALALQAPELVSTRVNPVMRLSAAFFRPVVVVLNATAFALMRLLRIPEPDRLMALYTSAELEIVTDEAAHSGELGTLQRDLIRSIFDLDHRTAGELMTPRPLVEAIQVSASNDQVTSRIAQSPLSRYPVTRRDLDDVIGVVHIKDVIRACQTPGTFDLAALVRPLPRVSPTVTAEELLGRFKREQIHAALVVNAAGRTIGFVTLDDVIADVMAESDDDTPPDRDDATPHGAGELSER